MSLIVPVNYPLVGFGLASLFAVNVGIQLLLPLGRTDWSDLAERPRWQGPKDCRCSIPSHVRNRRGVQGGQEEAGTSVALAQSLSSEA